MFYFYTYLLQLRNTAETLTSYLKEDLQEVVGGWHAKSGGDLFLRARVGCLLKKDLVAWLNSAAYPSSTHNGDITGQINNYFILYTGFPVCEACNLSSSSGYVSDCWLND